MNVTLTPGEIDRAIAKAISGALAEKTERVQKRANRFRIDYLQGSEVPEIPETSEGFCGGYFWACTESGARVYATFGDGFRLSLSRIQEQDLRCVIARVQHRAKDQCPIREEKVTQEEFDRKFRNMVDQIDNLRRCRGMCSWGRITGDEKCPLCGQGLCKECKWCGYGKGRLTKKRPSAEKCRTALDSCTSYEGARRARAELGLP